jgi:hypothetical protein
MNNLKFTLILTFSVLASSIATTLVINLSLCFRRRRQERKEQKREDSRRRLMSKEVVTRTACQVCKSSTAGQYEGVE